MKFEWTITIGNVLSILGFLGTIGIFLWKVEKRVTVLEVKFDAMVAAVEKVEHAINNWLVQVLKVVRH